MRSIYIDFIGISAATHGLTQSAHGLRRSGPVAVVENARDQVVDGHHFSALSQKGRVWATRSVSGVTYKFLRFKGWACPGVWKTFAWRSQYDRMKRWATKLQGRGDATGDQLDIYLTFFLNCYSLRHWFINSGAISASKLDNLIGASEAMRLCRDVCNRSKHLRLDRSPSTEADFSIAREYSPFGNRFVILFLGKKRDLLDVVVECVSF